MANLQGKTPVSYLQELCTKRSITPQYDLIANEGAVHEPVFVFKVSCGEFYGTGRGTSKKKAKHNAASQVLSKMTGVSNVLVASEANKSAENIEETTLTKDTCNKSNSSESRKVVLPSANARSSPATPPPTGSNPVGELQEMAQKNLWSPPIYDYTGEQGPPHQREFICSVRLGKSVEKGLGKSKKMAKRKAAHVMLTAIQTGAITIDPSEDLDCQNSSDPATNYTALKSTKSCPPLQPTMSQKVTQFYQNMRNSSGKQLNSLQDKQLNSVDMQYVNLLKDIASEQRFEVTYVNLDEQGFDGNFQVLLQLSTMPVAVVHGSGVTYELARSEAAHHALQYLKIMTRKT
ncbi:DgyrCDS9839 [Dimorphilus gyrociliatus]|uniref:DgyrCDS9839 n=1 Tax=Dimorphilus gyrociliatus TaxID=2664684 RepID=A0A7I8W0D4_9ANNE|nr:DgyrCDS9839 [Dimorphilus gyrociliatus]